MPSRRIWDEVFEQELEQHLVNRVDEKLGRIVDRVTERMEEPMNRGRVDFQSHEDEKNLGADSYSEIISEEEQVYDTYPVYDDYPDFDEEIVSDEGFVIGDGSSYSEIISETEQVCDEYPVYDEEILPERHVFDEMPKQVSVSRAAIMNYPHGKLSNFSLHYDVIRVVMILQDTENLDDCLVDNVKLKPKEEQVSCLFGLVSMSKIIGRIYYLPMMEMKLAIDSLRWDSGETRAKQSSGKPPTMNLIRPHSLHFYALSDCCFYTLQKSHMENALCKTESESNRVFNGPLFGVTYSRHVVHENAQFIFPMILNGKIKAWLYVNLGSRVYYRAVNRMYGDFHKRSLNVGGVDDMPRPLEELKEEINFNYIRTEFSSFGAPSISVRNGIPSSSGVRVLGEEHEDVNSSVIGTTDYVFLLITVIRLVLYVVANHRGTTRVQIEVVLATRDFGETGNTSTISSPEHWTFDKTHLIRAGAVFKQIVAIITGFTRSRNLYMAYLGKIKACAALGSKTFQFLEILHPEYVSLQTTFFDPYLIVGLIYDVYDLKPDSSTSFSDWIIPISNDLNPHLVSRIAIVTTHDFVSALIGSGICATFSTDTSKLICFLIILASREGHILELHYTIGLVNSRWFHYVAFFFDDRRLYFATTRPAHPSGVGVRFASGSFSLAGHSFEVVYYALYPSNANSKCETKAPAAADIEYDFVGIINNQFKVQPSADCFIHGLIVLFFNGFHTLMSARDDYTRVFNVLVDYFINDEGMVDSVSADTIITEYNIEDFQLRNEIRNQVGVLDTVEGKYWRIVSTPTEEIQIRRVITTNETCITAYTIAGAEVMKDTHNDLCKMIAKTGKHDVMGIIAAVIFSPLMNSEHFDMEYLGRIYFGGLIWNEIVFWDVGAFLTVAKYQGDFKERILHVLKEVAISNGRSVLFNDEFVADVMILLMGARAVLSYMDTMFGDRAAQEVIKACSGMFHPIFQLLYFVSIESFLEKSRTKNQTNLLEVPKTVSYASRVLRYFTASPTKAAASSITTIPAVFGIEDVGISELRTIPFKGGGDDTSVDTGSNEELILIIGNECCADFKARGVCLLTMEEG